jgi:hypothetical protein
MSTENSAFLVSPGLMFSPDIWKSFEPIVVVPRAGTSLDTVTLTVASLMATSPVFFSMI